MPTESETPPVLGLSVQTPSDLTGTWLVLKTLPRHTKALACSLSKQGLGYYLPLQEERRYLAGKKRTLITPVIEGYVFANYRSDDERWLMVDHGKVCKVIEVKNQAWCLRDLSHIHQWLAERDPSAINSFIGKTCVVTAGSLAGYQGPVISQRGGKVTIMLSWLGGAASPVEMDPEQFRLEVA